MTNMMADPASIEEFNRISDYFRRLRFDPAHHLGAGDIRITIGQQDEIANMAIGRLTWKERLLWGTVGGILGSVLFHFCKWLLS